MAIAECLTKLRTLAGLSNAELDRLSGLRKGHTWALERNEDPNPELKTLKGLAAALGTTVGYLANEEGDGPTPKAVTDAVANAREALTKASGGKDAA